MLCAIVTGAGSGIGRAAALRLAKDYAIVLAGRRPDPLEHVAREITSSGGKALAVPTDVSQPDQAQKLVKEALEAFGRIDVLVNNAGSAPMVKIATLSNEQWRDIFDTNLSSAFYLTRAVWPAMQKQFAQSRAATNSGDGEAAGGIIINISSMSSRDPFPGLGVYGAAKVAMNMLTLTTAREGKDVGIRAIGVAPGLVDTPMLRHHVSDEPIPPETLLAPDDIAKMIADAVHGSLQYCSGDTIFVHRQPA